MLCSYQLKMSDVYNFPIGKVKKLVVYFFDNEKYDLHYIAAQNLINYNGQNHMSKQKEAEQNGEKE